MFVESRDQARQFFLEVWRKLASAERLSPLETVLADVMRAHPEYHRLFDDPASAVARDFADSNPFLHMGLHVALVEQLQADRPAGIVALYRQLVLQQSGDVHALEHRMIDCLAAALWEASSSGQPPDEQGYLSRVRQLLR